MSAEHIAIVLKPELVESLIIRRRAVVFGEEVSARSIPLARMMAAELIAIVADARALYEVSAPILWRGGDRATQAAIERIRGEDFIFAIVRLSLGLESGADSDFVESTFEDIGGDEVCERLKKLIVAINGERDP
jgi:hypothetical protein